MPLLDHFHPPLHGPRRWEGFHHAWATFIAQQLNEETLPPGYYAESEISLGPAPRNRRRDDGSERNVRRKGQGGDGGLESLATKDCRQGGFRASGHLRSAGLRGPGSAELRAAIEIVSPANKDRAGSRRTFAAKCAGYLRHGISVVIIDVVTARAANLHRELFDVLEAKTRRIPWESPSGLYAVAYRAVTVRRRPRVEVWPEVLDLGRKLPILPLWLSLDLCVPLPLDKTYNTTRRSLRISAWGQSKG